VQEAVILQLIVNGEGHIGLIEACSGLGGVHPGAVHRSP
jgi:hypothetical protein